MLSSAQTEGASYHWLCRLVDFRRWSTPCRGQEKVHYFYHLKFITRALTEEWVSRKDDVLMWNQMHPSLKRQHKVSTQREPAVSWFRCHYLWTMHFKMGHDWSTNVSLSYVSWEMQLSFAQVSRTQLIYSQCSFVLLCSPDYLVNSEKITCQVFVFRWLSFIGM